jgi:hypothetical protein
MFAAVQFDPASELTRYRSRRRKVAAGVLVRRLPRAFAGATIDGSYHDDSGIFVAIRI